MKICRFCGKPIDEVEPGSNQWYHINGDIDYLKCTVAELPQPLLFKDYLRQVEKVNNE